MIGSAYLQDVLARLRDTKAMADRALEQIPEHVWFRRLDPESNSLATGKLRQIRKLPGNCERRPPQLGIVHRRLLSNDGDPLRVKL